MASVGLLIGLCFWGPINLLLFIFSIFMFMMIVVDIWGGCKEEEDEYPRALPNAPFPMERMKCYINYQYLWCHA